MVEFEFEFYSKVPDPEDALRREASRRLNALGKGRNDIIGANVVIEELTGEATPNCYQARVVVYIRPVNITSLEKAKNPEGALKGALSAVERQVREKRNRLRETWKQP